jgi:hypothetical protein
LFSILITFIPVFTFTPDGFQKSLSAPIFIHILVLRLAQCLLVSYAMPQYVSTYNCGIVSGLRHSYTLGLNCEGSASWVVILRGW